MTADDVLNTAIAMVKTGNKAQGQRLLERYIRANPQHVTAWLWEARACPSTESRLHVLEMCLAHNPTSQRAQQALLAVSTQLRKPAV